MHVASRHCPFGLLTHVHGQVRYPRLALETPVWIQGLLADPVKWKFGRVESLSHPLVPKTKNETMAKEVKLRLEIRTPLTSLADSTPSLVP